MTTNRFGIRPFTSGAEAAPAVAEAPDLPVTKPWRFAPDDEMGYFLIHDPELATAYYAALTAADLQWTDEEVAEAAFRQRYGDHISDLMMAWRFRRALGDVMHPDHAKAVAVYRACERWQDQQRTNHS